MGLDPARAIQEELQHDLDCTVWNQGIFQPGKTPIEALTKALNEHDFAVFIFVPEDVVTLKGKSSETVRDNVLFELGLFIGKLGRERTFFVVPQGEEQMHIATDLAGITPANYNPNNKNWQAAVSSACFHIRTRVRELGKHNVTP
jgi:predicted nucleotide-binding protein